MTIIQYFRQVRDLPIRESHRVSNLKLISNHIHGVQIEQCFYIDIEENQCLSPEELNKIEWLLADPLDRAGLSQSKFLCERDNSVLVEIGPR